MLRLKYKNQDLDQTAAKDDGLKVLLHKLSISR